MVAIKVIGVLLVIGVGAFYINTANWFPFIPPEVVGADGKTHFGFQGVVAAASVVFFAVFGYDTLTTAAEESKNPQRDLPRAILLSLGLSMVLYLTISFVITGVAHYSTLNNDAPVANAFQSLGLTWISAAISAVAVASIISVVFAFMLAAARIWFSLARDGLLPSWFAKVHPRYGTPYRPTLILGVLTGLAAGALPIGDLAELVNVGVLCAFIVICASIVVLRRTRPEVRRAFRTPLVPLVPIIGIVFSIWLLTGLPLVTWERFGLWMLAGFVIYFGYGIRHSGLAKKS